jgi:hypothetical protein
MDARDAFMRTAQTIFIAHDELVHFRIAGLTAKIAILQANVYERGLHEASDLSAVVELRKVGPRDFNHFALLFDELSIILAYSWVDTFLSQLEEALYLHNPASLGESIQIKLGKILSSPSVGDLLHEIARRRTRDKGAWSLKGRLVDIDEQHDVKTTVLNADVDWFSELRNNLVHNRRPGAYKAHRSKISYETVSRKKGGDAEVKRALGIAFRLLADMYENGSRALGISRRFARHKANMNLVQHLRSSSVYNYSVPETSRTQPS